MDADAFDEFYAGSFARVVGQVYAMCGNFAEAQDCTQEAFVRAWARCRQLDQAPVTGGMGANRGLAPRSEPLAASATGAAAGGPVEGPAHRGSGT